MKRRWNRLRADERGTSLTEFVITLPIFMAVMSFVYYMGVAGHVLTQESGEAQRLLWEDVVSHTRMDHVPPDPSDPDQPHVDPAMASQLDRGFLDDHNLRQRREDLKDEMRTHEEGTYEALAGGGHWGQSHRRTRPADERADLAHHADQITADPAGVVGGAGYARDLVDDTSSASPIEMGSGGPDALQPASTSTAATGLAPALGAGMRYGVAHEVREGVVNLPRDWSFSVRIHYDVLVPPAPRRNDHQVAGITRMQLEEYEPYRTLLGIQEPTAESLSEATAPSVPDWPEE